MTNKKIIAVVGGTGKQGGGLVRAILDDPDGPFAARVLTRHPDSPAASAFAATGAEIVFADLNDEVSLRTAFDGAYGAFVVTNYWEPAESSRTPAQREIDHARNAAQAAKGARLQHVVWSTLEDTRPYKPQRDPDGQLVLSLPIGDSEIAMVGAEDVGRTAYGILLAGVRYIGRTIGLAGDHVSGDRLAEIFTKVLGEKVVYRRLTHHDVRGAGQPPAAVERANMWQFYSDAADSLLAHRDLNRIRSINPRLQPLENWLLEHREELA